MVSCGRGSEPSVIGRKFTDKLSDHQLLVPGSPLVIQENVVVRNARHVHGRVVVVEDTFILRILIVEVRHSCVLAAGRTPKHVRKKTHKQCAYTFINIIQPVFRLPIVADARNLSHVLPSNREHLRAHTVGAQTQSEVFFPLFS